MRPVVVLALLLAAAAPARAETVSGTFTFTDSDGMSTPIANATVEVWRREPRGWFGWWDWGVDMTAFTDANGHLSVALPFITAGVNISLRVYATNPAVVVKQQDIPWQPFYAKPGSPNVELMATAMSAGDSFDFSFNFASPYDANHFNVAAALQVAFGYANARRDPRETDTIGQMAVNMQSPSTPTFFDPNTHEIRLNNGFAMDDLTVIHEYAHFLESRISSFSGIASYHDGCQFLTAAPPFGVDIASQGMAWMEGFADYFAQAVRLSKPGAHGPANPIPILTPSGGPFGTSTTATLENPSCPSSTHPREEIEDFVAGALWDLIDPQSSEVTDRFCANGFDTDRIVFQIFDHELGMIGGNPGLQDFLDAWVGRGFDLSPLQTTWGTTISNLFLPQAVLHYDLAPRADWAIWRPNGGNWFVLWPNGHAEVVQWGQPNDVPLPGDYDGDMKTDLVVWRPGDGNWFVMSSRTGFTHATQWGDPTDVPLPADYDGDREMDFAVYRPGTQTLWIKDDNCGPDRAIALGSGTAVVGDFDGDGKADPGVWDALAGMFTIQKSSGGVLQQPMPGGFLVAPVIGDYDGDLRADFAVFAIISGTWTIRYSSTGQIVTYTLGGPHGGKLRIYARAVPADLDGDGRTDPAVWYNDDGMWYALGSRDGSLMAQQWGQPGDIPVPAK